MTSPPPTREAATRRRSSSSTPQSPPIARSPAKTDVSALTADDAVLFCGWSMKKGTMFGSYPRFFALRKDAAGASLAWYEEEKGKEDALKLSGALDVKALSAIKREKPTSESDFTFRIVAKATDAGKGSTLRVDPGSKVAFDQWNEALMAAMSI